MSNFQPLEVVDRGNETQPQVVENVINYLSRMRINTINILLKITKANRV